MPRVDLYSISESLNLKFVLINCLVISDSLEIFKISPHLLLAYHNFMYRNYDV